MSVILYFDEDAQEKELIRLVRNAGIFASSVNEQNTRGWSDEEQLIFATSKGWSLFSYNVGDFDQLHSQWILDGKRHHGIIVAEQISSSNREKVLKLARLIKGRSAEQMHNNLEYLSSW
ncbi:MAG: DUF5615 family PIN-like protein [Planctomycetota bacterium]